MIPDFFFFPGRQKYGEAHNFPLKDLLSQLEMPTMA